MWLPLAWGYWAILAILILVLVLMIGLHRFYHRAPKAKHIALEQLRHTDSAVDALNIVRRVALCYFPRSSVASLTGDAWYQFLDQHLAEPRFSTKSEQWQHVLYQPNSDVDHATLVQDCIDWVEHTAPPKTQGGQHG